VHQRLVSVPPLPAVRNAAVAQRVAEQRLRRDNADLADGEAWIACLEAVQTESLARTAVIAAEIDAPVPDVFGDDEDGTWRYNAASTRRHRRAQFRQELAILRERLAAIEKGGMGGTDLLELLAARGIRPLPGQSLVNRGRCRLPLPKARQVVEALRADIARAENDLVQAKDVLAKFSE
jgi:hypothetical protein